MSQLFQVPGAAVRLGAVELDRRAFHGKLKEWREQAVAQVGAAGTDKEKRRVREHLYR